MGKNETSICKTEFQCNVEKTLNIIGGKWSFLIVKQLFNRTMRFGEIKKSLNNISPKTLTSCLRDLEKHKILTRKVFPTIPPAVEYTLTEKGKDLNNVINEMKLWGKKWAE